MDEGPTTARGRPTDTVATRFERGKRDSFQVATKHELWILDYMDSFYFIFLTYFFFFFSFFAGRFPFFLLSQRRPRLSPLYIIHQLTFPVPTDFLFVYFFMFSSQPNGSFEQGSSTTRRENDHVRRFFSLIKN